MTPLAQVPKEKKRSADVYLKKHHHHMTTQRGGPPVTSSSPHFLAWTMTGCWAFHEHATSRVSSSRYLRFPW